MMEFSIQIFLAYATNLWGVFKQNRRVNWKFLQPSEFTKTVYELLNLESFFETKNQVI